MTNIDFVDHRINPWNLNGGSMNGLQVGRWGDGSGHYGKITDFNVWDYPLSRGEMENWTTCRLVFLWVD